MKTVIIVAVIALIFASAGIFLVFPNLKEKELVIKAGKISECLIGGDHTAEGIVVTMKNGDIGHFFRLDPGEEGNHTGNNAYIVGRISKDGGKSWGEPFEIFKDEWDDRNVHGGITREGRIVLFFRRYNAATGSKVDINCIYSDDNARTWSDRKVIPTNCLVFGTGQMVYIPEKKLYLMQGYYKPNRFEIWSSKDGSEWEKYSEIDYEENQYRLNEFAITYVGKGRMIGLLRSEYSNFQQITSSDWGKTWSQPRDTNLGEMLFTPSPELFYDEESKRVIVLTNDRRGDSEEEFFIYANKPAEVFSKPMEWTLVDRFARPVRHDMTKPFYGYPTYTRVGDKYLVIFTENFYKDNGFEDTDLYQFELEIKVPFVNKLKDLGFKVKG